MEFFRRDAIAHKLTNLLPKTKIPSKKSKGKKVESINIYKKVFPFVLSQLHYIDSTEISSDIICIVKGTDNFKFFQDHNAVLRLHANTGTHDIYSVFYTCNPENRKKSKSKNSNVPINHDIKSNEYNFYSHGWCVIFRLLKLMQSQPNYPYSVYHYQIIKLSNKYLQGFLIQSQFQYFKKRIDKSYSH